MRRVRHRLPWLIVGLAGSMLATFVVARFETALSAKPALADIRLLLILVERNPTVLAALFRPSPAVEANFSLRVKLVESSAVYAVAITTDGQACFARKTIQVTQGACGA